MFAFSFYFLSKIDQAYHLNILKREVFISIWVIVFIMLGLYFLGKIKFVHDNDLNKIGVPRFFLSIASLSFALYLFTGLLGAELKGLSTVLPPDTASASVISGTRAGSASGTEATALCNSPKYSDFLTLPHGLNGYFDYQEALACAQEQNKRGTE